MINTATRNLLIVFLLMYGIPVYAQFPGYQYFPLEKDKKSIRINCLYKNRNGYLLVGSDNGLYKFDGERFNPVYFNNKDYTDTVTAIFEDNQQKTWVGFRSGRIAHVISNKLIYYNPEEGTPRKRITAFVQDNNQQIWFATAGEGVYYHKNNHLYLLNEENGLSDLHVNALALAKNGDIIAGTDQGLNICHPNGGKVDITVIGTRNGLPDYIITGITPAGNDNFWIGLQEKGFCHYRHATGAIDVPSATHNWPYGEVNSMLPINKKLWIATRGNGLLSYDLINGTTDTIGLNQTGRDINSLEVDQQGNVWLTSPTWGLVRTPGESLKLTAIPGNPVFEHVHAILAEKNGVLWANDQQNRLIRFNGKDNSAADKLISLPGVTEKTDITALYQDAYNNIWVGTMGKGIFIVNPVNFRLRVFAENPVFKDAGILSINGNGNNIYISSLQGSMHIVLNESNHDLFNPYQFSNYDNKSTGTNYIYDIFQDSRNRLWFATDGNGLTMLENGHYTYYHEKNLLKDDHIYSITEDKSGHIWFSTAGAGIYRFDGKTFSNFGLKEGLSDLHISVLTTDGNGNIIIVNKAGLDILDPKTGNISYLHNNPGIGTVNAEDLGAANIDSAGNILVSTTRGILAYTQPSFASHTPKALIESVQLFLDDIGDTSRHSFAHDENNFTFNFTGLYYTNPEKVYYQYQLEGLDSSWITTRDRSKNFPKLSPGKYRFRIRASLNKNFSNSSEAGYSFIIRKAFYREYWFMALCLFITGGLLYWYIRNREKELKKMERLRQEKIQVQFEVLRTQVNPHFLFNSFNTLISTIEDDPKMAVEYAEQLSDFFRDIINYRDKEVISLKEEVNLLENYLQLQRKRYGSQLELDIKIPEEKKQYYSIPPLTLQLLTENAIKHNTVSKEKKLTISLEIDNAEQLLVKNNINPRFSKQAGAGMGLQNIINRYNLLSNRKVNVTETNQYFIVSLPLLKT